jgi:hypothetical protein
VTVNVLFAFALAAVLALPPALAAQERFDASSASQDPPVTSSSPAQQQTGNASNKTKQKKDKGKKVKKSNCVSPPPGSGLTDYCKNPYWRQPNMDWQYIQSNQGAVD